MTPSTEAWLAEARRYAFHIYCYAELIDDHGERSEAAAMAGENVYEFVEALGERYGLDRTDQNWASTRTSRSKSGWCGARPHLVLLSIVHPISPEEPTWQK